MHTALRAERNCLQHVRAAIDAAIHDDVRPPGDRIDDLRQHFDATARAIELPAAMVGDVDRTRTMLDGEPGILGRRDALEDDWQRRALADAFDRLPREPRSDHARLGGGDRLARASLAQDLLSGGIGAGLAAAGAEPVDEIALAPGVVGRLGDDRDGDASSRLCLVDSLVEPGLVAAHVEPEDQRMVDFGAHHVERRIGEGAVDEQRTERLARARDADRGSRIDERQGADGRHHHRQRELVPEKRRRGVDAGDVAQYARTEGEPVESVTIAPKRDFRLGAAVDEIPHGGLYFAVRDQQHLLQRREISHGSHSFRSAGRHYAKNRIPIVWRTGTRPLQARTMVAKLALTRNLTMELAMYARVMTSSPKPGAAETAIAEWPQHIGAFKGKGLVAGYLFFDRAANQFLSITIWESEEAQKRNATSPEQIHGRAEFMKHLTGAPIPSNYEVAAVVK